MKKVVLLATAALFLLAGTAMAESIAGKVGVTLRGGASYAFDSEFLFVDEGPADRINNDIKADTGWTGGLGIMYGINDNLAVTFDVIYLQTDLAYDSAEGETDFLTAKTVDFSLGAQWRFMPKSAFVPYIGAGLDVLWNKIESNNSRIASDVSFDVDPTYGCHLSVGADYFFTPNIAFNAEIRSLYSTKGDISSTEAGSVDSKFAEYNPTNISGFLGIRFFF